MSPILPWNAQWNDFAPSRTMIMAAVKLSLRDDLLQHDPAEIPRAGLVVSTILSMSTFAVLAVCLSKSIDDYVQLT